MARRAITPRPGGSQPVPYSAAPQPKPTAREMGFTGTLRFGLLFILIFIFGFGAWAALAPLESAAIAPGEIVVEGDRQTVEHLEGGIVGEILVKEGDIVSAGEPLILLDDTQARASVGVLNTRLTYAAALEARLIAEAVGAAELQLEAGRVVDAHPTVVARRRAFEQVAAEGGVVVHRASNFCRRKFAKDLRFERN